MIGKVTEATVDPQGLTHHTHIDLKITLIFCLSPSQMESISAWNTTRNTTRRQTAIADFKRCCLLFAASEISFYNNTSQRDRDWKRGVESDENKRRERKRGEKPGWKKRQCPLTLQQLHSCNKKCCAKIIGMRDKEKAKWEKKRNVERSKQEEERQWDPSLT